MENASKALLIAGEMLIAMLVAAMMALMFSTMSSYADEYAEQRKIQEVQAFNANITQYAKDKDCTAQDIVSLAYFAKQVNEQLGCTAITSLDTDHDNNHIKVQVKNKSNNMEIESDDSLRTFLQNNSYDSTSKDFVYYKATIQNYFEDGRIQKIYFEPQ